MYTLTYDCFIAVLRFLNSARDIHNASHDYVKTGVFLRTQYMCLCAQMCRYYMFRCMRVFICICVVEYLCRRTEEITNVKESRVTNLLKQQQQTLAARLTDWKHTHTCTQIHNECMYIVHICTYTKTRHTHTHTLLTEFVHARIHTITEKPKHVVEPI